MRQSRFVAMLSAVALGTVSFGQVQVAIRDMTEFPNAVPAVLNGVVMGTDNVVTVSTANMLAAIPGSTIGHDFVMWVFDEHSLTGAPQESIGAINIVYDSQSPVGNIRLLVAPAPLPGATNSQADFHSLPDTSMASSGAIEMRSITVSSGPAHK